MLGTLSLRWRWHESMSVLVGLWMKRYTGEEGQDLETVQVKNIREVIQTLVREIVRIVEELKLWRNLGRSKVSA